MKYKKSFFLGLLTCILLFPGCRKPDCVPWPKTVSADLVLYVLDGNGGQPVPDTEVSFSSYIKSCEFGTHDRHYITKKTDASGMVSYSRIFGFTFLGERGRIDYRAGESCRGAYGVSSYGGQTAHSWSNSCVIDELE